MRIIYFSTLWTVVIDLIAWASIHLGISYFSMQLPVSMIQYDSRFFWTRAWEDNGYFYGRWFRVKLWKSLMPSWGNIMKSKGLKIRMLALSIGILIIPITGSIAKENKQAIEVERIDVKKAWEKVQAGKALLVCSYDDDACKKIFLKGAMFRSEFESRLPLLPKNQEIIFYCQ